MATTNPKIPSDRNADTQATYPDTNRQLYKQADTASIHSKKAHKKPSRKGRHDKQTGRHTHMQA
jgi:hypothetical protein